MTCSYLTTRGITVFIVHVLHVTSMDVKPQKERYMPSFDVYHNFSSLALSFENFIRRNPDIVRHVNPEKYVSKHGRSQFVLHLTNFYRNNTQSTSKAKFLLSFGEHAREFFPTESLLYLLKQLASERWTVDQAINLNQIEIYVIGLANPDGRVHVEQTENFCWRGTHSGVDINRNFDWEFGGKGSSDDPKDEEYRGAKPFSEQETFVYRDLTEKINFDGFISLHSGIKQIYIPFADTKSRLTGRVPENIGEMTKLAKEMAMSTKFKYQHGQAASLNDYTADGTIFDYMAGKRKIPFSYAIELWGPDRHTGPSCFDLFNPQNNQLQTVTSEVYPLYVKFMNYIQRWKLSRENSSQHILQLDLPKTKLESSSDKHHIHFGLPTFTRGLILLCILVAVSVAISQPGKYLWCRRIYQRRRVISLKALGSTLSLNLFHV